MNEGSARKNFRKYWLRAFGLLLFVLLSFVLYIYQTWQGFKEIQANYKIPHSAELSSDALLGQIFVLKKNNRIIESDLKRLLPFLELGQPPSDWWHEQLEDGLLLMKEKVYLNGQIEQVVELAENIEFEFDRINDCQLPACFQKKVAFFDVPPALWRGLIGVEDERFLNHRGVDPLALMRALWVDIKKGSLAQGGSTITQQVARNLYLGREKSFSRKWREILFSLFMEWELTKEDILQIYFNEVFWGSLGGIRLQGVYSASVFYFDKKPADLEPYEVSILIAMLKGPNYYHPLRNTPRVRERANVLFKKLQEMELVAKRGAPWSDQQWKKWEKLLKQTQNDLRVSAIAALFKKAPSQISLYQEYVLVSTAEIRLAEIKKKPKLKDQEMAYKLLIEDVSCIYGGAECPSPFHYYSKQERGEDAAFYEEAHQIGSLLKPIIYRGIIQSGKTFADKVSTQPISIKLLSGIWEPQESTPSESYEIYLDEALQKSRNIPLIRLAEEVGFEHLETFLYPYVSKLQKPLRQFPAQLLGSIELTMQEVSHLYEKFIHDECVDILQQKITALTSPMLVLSNPGQTTIANAATGLIRERRFFGKTGTSSKGNDNWFVGFDGRYLSVLWVGNEKKEEGYSLELSGAWSAYKIFEQFAIYKGEQLPDLSCELFLSNANSELPN